MLVAQDEAEEVPVLLFPLTSVMFLKFTLTHKEPLYEPYREVSGPKNHNIDVGVANIKVVLI